MLKLFSRGFLAVVMSTAMLPGQSSACCFCHCFDWCCSKPAPPPACPTTYAAPACDVCPQQVSYVPQTAYRTECSCVPCTSYRPVSTCDPCGGAQTVMQPVTTYVRRPVMVPYTTYRPVVSQVRYAAPACTTCGTDSALLCRRRADKFGGSRGACTRLRHLWRRCIGELRSGPSTLYVSQFGRPSGIC